MMPLPLTPAKDWKSLNKPQSQVLVVINTLNLMLKIPGDLVNKKNLLQLNK